MAYQAEQRDFKLWLQVCVLSTCVPSSCTLITFHSAQLGPTCVFCSILSMLLNFRCDLPPSPTRSATRSCLKTCLGPALRTSGSTSPVRGGRSLGTSTRVASFVGTSCELSPLACTCLRSQLGNARYLKTGCVRAHLYFYSMAPMLTIVAGRTMS